MPTNHLTTTTLQITGMTCTSCSSAIESGLTPLLVPSGTVTVSLALDRAVITHDVTLVPVERLISAIEDRGFEATLLASDAPVVRGGDGGQITTLRVGGMTCGACTSAVEGAFAGVEGVQDVKISLLAERAVIVHDGGVVSAGTLAEMVEDVGFEAEVLETKKVGGGGGGSGAGREVMGVEKRLVTTTVAVQGMTCGACTSAVEGGFGDVEGVVQFNISLLAERAVLVHDADLLTAERIVEIIEERGFDALILSSVEEGMHATGADSTIQLKIYGLPSPESAADLQVNLQDTYGVVSASVNFNTIRATVVFSAAKIGLRGVVAAVEKQGFDALVADSEDNNAQLESLAKTKEIQEWSQAFRISLSFAIPVFVISMVLPMFLPFLDFGRIRIPFIPGLWLGDVVCLALTIPVQFGVGKRFYISAYRSVKHGSPTMDVLVVLGTSAAFFFSCAAMTVSILTPPHSRPSTIFDTSTMLLTFITLGRFLENRAKGQTSKALSRLMCLAPPMATIYSDPIAATKAAESWDQYSLLDEKKALAAKEGMSGLSIEEKMIPTELIEVGDIVILKPGDKIPADGIVTRGESYVNESMVTGEAMPVSKKPGSPLMAGTVNNAGRMDFKVTRAGRDTQLSQIVRLVQEAQTSRAPIQRMADKVAGYFVPIIIILGLSTFIAWMILSHVLSNPPKIFTNNASGGRLMVCVQLCIAVIVFACPCALGLATPTAVMVGTGIGAEQGILVKGGAALETATRVTHIVLDKTGTLTMGKMSVSSSTIIGRWKKSAEQTRIWWSVVGLAESNSEHPIAKAILDGARSALRLAAEAQIEGNMGDFEATVGKGISASAEAGDATCRQRYQVLIGNASYLRSKGVEVPVTPEEQYDELSGPDQQAVAGASSSRNKTSGQHAGITTIHIAIDEEYAGSLGLSDTLKPSSRAMIDALHRMNIQTSLVTGDQAATALHVAALVGVSPENVFAGVLPDGKKRIVSDFQRQGQIVAMVGDGINDSPALATADVGISLASGTDVAMDAADIVLMKPTQLMDIPASLHLSRTIFNRIKLNLLLSSVYNAIGLPVAMGFLLPWGITLPPLAAGAAMACSSVTVVVSSLLLKLWRRPRWMLEEGEEGLLIRSSKRPGLLSRLGGLLGGRKRRDGERDRGAYVQLDNYEAV